MRTAEQMMEDYQQFRGKCKEFAESAVLQDRQKTQGVLLEMVERNEQ